MLDDNSIAARLEQTLVALREREQDLASLLENAQDFVVYRVAIDPTAPHGGRVDLVSPSIRELLGIADPYRFETWFAALHPEDKPRVLEANRRAWQEGVPYNQAARVFHPLRKTWVWVHTLSRPVFDENGVLTHFNGLILDITEQKWAEAALQEQIAFSTLITTISTRFISLPLEEIDSGIDDALAMVGIHTDVDRSYVFLYTNHGRTMDCRHEWCAEGIASQVSRLQAIPVDALAWSNAILQRGDVLHIPRVADLPPEAQAEKDEFLSQDIRSLVAVPIIYRGDVLGLLGFDAVRYEKTWTEEDRNLLQILGAIFANALEHKRSQQALQQVHHMLEQRVEERTLEIERRRQAAESLGDILKLLNSAEPLDDILQAIVRQACRLGEADAGVIYRYDEVGLTSSIVAMLDMPPGFVHLGPFSLTNTNPQRAVAGNQPHCVPDFDPYFATLALPDDPMLRRWYTLVIENFKAKLTAPIFILDRPYGALELFYREPRVFSSEIIEVVVMIGNQTALAIENARLREQAEEAAVAAERNRIARELHDSVSQALYGIALGTRTARTLVERQPVEDKVKTTLVNPLDYVLSLADAGLAEMRALIFELRPDALEKEGLVAALIKQAEAIRVRQKLNIQTDLCAEPELPPAAKEALYRVAQEAFNNLVKHAHASRVDVRLRCADGVLTLQVQDDGKGFNPQAEYPGHLGLHTMRERVSRLGGTLEITSAPGQGTTVQASLPV